MTDRLGLTGLPAGPRQHVLLLDRRLGAGRFRPRRLPGLRLQQPNAAVRFKRLAGPNLGPKTQPVGAAHHGVRRRPKAGGMVVAGRDHGPAVGPERHGADLVALPQRRPDRLARGCIPQPGGTVLPSRQHLTAVGAERHGQHLAGMHERPADLLARRDVPQPCRAVPAAGQASPAVGPESQRHDRPLMMQHPRRPCGDVPQSGGPVAAARQQRFAVGAEGQRDDLLLVPERAGDEPGLAKLVVHPEELFAVLDAADAGQIPLHVEFGRVPDPHLAVRRRRGDQPAVRGEGDRVDGWDGVGQFDAGRGVRVPDFQRHRQCGVGASVLHVVQSGASASANDQRLAVGADGQGVDGLAGLAVSRKRLPRAGPQKGCRSWFSDAISCHESFPSPPPNPPPPAMLR